MTVLKMFQVWKPGDNVCVGSHFVTPSSGMGIQFSLELEYSRERASKLGKGVALCMNTG